MKNFILDYRAERFGGTVMLHADCFDWLKRLPECSIDAIVTDPPYGVKEYEVEEIERLQNGGRGGIWRIPPSFDGNTRAPLPRFTALEKEERQTLARFFRDFARAVMPVLKPGAHVFLASNAFLSQLVFFSMVEG